MKKILILLIISDILILSGFGLIVPILAIFIKEGLTDGTVVSAGIAVGIFWTLKSLLQLPFSRYIDTKRKKTKFLILGTLLIVCVPFIYLFSSKVIHIYIAQMIYAIGAALAYPTWMSIFTMNVDKKHRGFEWSVWSACVGLGTGISAFIGGRVVVIFGFRSLFLVSGIFALFGFLILFLINKSQTQKINTIKELRLKHLKK